EDFVGRFVRADGKQEVYWEECQIPETLLTPRRLRRRNIIIRHRASLGKKKNRAVRSRISRLKPRQRRQMRRPPKRSKSPVIWKSHWRFSPSSRIWNFIPAPISRR